MTVTSTADGSAVCRRRNLPAKLLIGCGVSPYNRCQFNCLLSQTILSVSPLHRGGCLTHYTERLSSEYQGVKVNKDYLYRILFTRPLSNYPSGKDLYKFVDKMSDFLW